MQVAWHAGILIMLLLRMTKLRILAKRPHAVMSRIVRTLDRIILTFSLTVLAYMPPAVGSFRNARPKYRLSCRIFPVNTKSLVKGLNARSHPKKLRYRYGTLHGTRLARKIAHSQARSPLWLHRIMRKIHHSNAFDHGSDPGTINHRYWKPWIA